MRTIALLASLLLPVVPAAAQHSAATNAAPPHAFLFGAWTGGLFPAPVTLNAQECLAQPTVIFTRDSVFRVSITDPAYLQRLVETVRATSNGVVFRLVAPPQTPQAGYGMFNLMPESGEPPGFGCADPNVLQVQRRGENEISFPNCPQFPYPLIRCPAR
jgi:hypothetical protein